jgi:hypothetical protein
LGGSTWRGGKREGDEGVNITEVHFIYIYLKTTQLNPPKIVKKGRRRRLIKTMEYKWSEFDP